MGLRVDVENIFCEHLPISEATIYQVPNGRRTLIKAIKLVSEADMPMTVNMKVIRGSNYARLVPYNFQLCGRHMADLDELVTMEAGDKLTGSSSMARTVTCKVSGVEEVL